MTSCLPTSPPRVAIANTKYQNPLAVTFGFLPDAVRPWPDVEARGSRNTNQVRRLPTLAAIYGGSTRTGAALIGSGTVQIMCGWVAKLNAHEPAGLIDRRRANTPLGIGHGDRRQADPGRPWRGALACDRPVPMVVGRLRGGLGGGRGYWPFVPPCMAATAMSRAERAE